MPAVESATVIMTAPKRAAPLAPPARPARPVDLVPVRKLTRAHLALARRPALAAEAAATVGALATALSEQLGASVTFEPKLCDTTLHPVAHLAAGSAFAVLELNGDGLGVLELDPLTVGALMKHAAGSAGPLAAPVRLTRIEEAALGWQLLSALSVLRAQGPFHERYRPRLVSMHFDRAEVIAAVDARRRHVAIAFTVRIGEVNGSARLLVPSTWLQLVAEQLPEAQPGPIDPSVAEARLEATVLAGAASVGRADLAALTPGDVLVVPGLNRQGAAICGPARVLFSSFELRGSLTAAGLTFTRATPRPALESPMEKSDPTLPIDVEVQLTRVRVPVSDLAVLKPGGVLPLQIGAAQTVVLRVGDRAVARAELVEVDGEIGARILQLL